MFLIVKRFVELHATILLKLDSMMVDSSIDLTICHYIKIMVQRCGDAEACDCKKSFFFTKGA